MQDTLPSAIDIRSVVFPEFVACADSKDWKERIESFVRQATHVYS